MYCSRFIWIITQTLSTLVVEVCFGMKLELKHTVHRETIQQFFKEQKEYLIYILVQMSISSFYNTFIFENILCFLILS